MRARGGLSGALGAIYGHAPTAEEIHWQLKGLCRNDDPQKWTPDPPDVEKKSQEAKEICHRCPVVQECQNWALSHREVYGVWGGLTERERARKLRGARYGRRDSAKLAEFYASA